MVSKVDQASQALVTESDISILVSNDLAIAQPHLHLAWDH